MSAALEPGTVVARDFRVIRSLRAGGMGAVYLVEQLSTGAERALKVMRPELADDETTRERFMQEARVGSKIESDHVVEVVAAGCDDAIGAPYLVMEFLKGEELGDLLGRVGALPLCDAAEILSQLGHALSRAHARGIVHRDLKPENLFLATGRRRDAPFTVKILDFGIAKLVEERQHRATQPLGTPLFMAPEQTERSGRISPATDVWALGLIAFTMLTGRDFWRAADDSLSRLIREITVEPIPWASERALDLGVQGVLPEAFDDWFARCVVRDPASRFPHAGEAVQAFSRLAAEAEDSRSSVLASVFHSADDRSRLAEAATELPGALAAPASAFGTRSPAVITTDLVGRGLPWRWPLLIVAFAGAALSARWLIAARGAPGLRPEASSAFATAGSAVAPIASAAHGGLPPDCPKGMQLISGGSMFLGERGGLENARPAHKVRVGEFCFDTFETTARAYDRCVESGNCLKPPHDVSFPGVTNREREALSPLCNSRQAGREEHPINCVDWSMAQNFCRAKGGRLPGGGARLPTEAEWEYAARGSSQRAYPWGDEPPSPERVNACGAECTAWLGAHLGEASKSMFDADDGYAGTSPVGSFRAGASGNGLMDLAGNVWEWTADWFGAYSSDEAEDPQGPPSGSERVVRGGAYNASHADWLKPAYRWKTSPDVYNPAIGFRCALTLPTAAGAKVEGLR